MVAAKHYDIYLSCDADETQGIITSRPPFERPDVHRIGNALRAVEALRESDESRWGAAAIGHEARFSQRGISPTRLLQAGSFLSDLLVEEGHTVTLHHEIKITDSGFYPVDNA